MNIISNNISKLLILLLSFSFILVSCDVIDEGDRLIVDDQIPERPDVKKKVLLEEFTGIYCKNCPEASAIAHDIQKNLGEQLVVVNLHAGIFSSNSDLASPAAKEYHDHFYTQSQKYYPSGMISRTKIDGKYAQESYSKWDNMVMTRLESDFLKDKEFSFTIYPEYSEENNNISVRTEIESVDALSGLKLQLWVTESKLIRRQSTPDGNVDYNYEHNHVLRDAINGIWGEAIPAIPPVSTYEMQSEAYSLEGKDWVVENLDIVAFIYDAASEEVLDVIEVKLIDNN